MFLKGLKPPSFLAVQSPGLGSEPHASPQAGCSAASPHASEEVQPWIARETSQLLTASSFQAKLKIITEDRFWGAGGTALSVSGAGQQTPTHIIISC